MNALLLLGMAALGLVAGEVVSIRSGLLCLALFPFALGAMALQARAWRRGERRTLPWRTAYLTLELAPLASLLVPHPLAGPDTIILAVAAQLACTLPLLTTRKVAA